MPKQTSTSKCLVAFGAGIAVGIGAGMAARASTPKAFEILAIVLERMGFALGDILLLLWNPEGETSTAELPPTKNVTPPSKKAKSQAPRRNGRSAGAAVNRRNVPVSSLRGSRRSSRTGRTLLLN